MQKDSLPLCFLFPFELVPAKSNVLIYGAAQMGQEYLRQIELTGYCRVTGFVDRNYQKYTGSRLEVYPPCQIHALAFDYVVVAVQNSAYLPEILRVLAEQGVAEDRVVGAGVRQWEGQDFLGSIKEIVPLREIAPEADVHIAFRLYSALGSMLFLKWLVADISRHLPDSAIDLYMNGLEDEARFLFSDVPQVRRFMDDLGGRYEAHAKDYDIAMRLHGAGIAMVDCVIWDGIPVKYRDFRERLRIFEERTKEDDFLLKVPRSAIFLRRRFQGRNAYTAMGYGVFGNTCKATSIPWTEEGRVGFERLGLSFYATINFGNGSCKDDSKIAKSWPLDRLEAVVAALHRMHPELAIVQLGARDAKKVHGANSYVLGEKLSLVTQVLRNSFFHLDIEGGLVHLATQLGTKCFVLFGPTPEFYYGYEDNVNIKAGTCHDCCGVYLDHNRCARDMAQPECMYGITPEMVLSKINEAWPELMKSR